MLIEWLKILKYIKEPLVSVLHIGGHLAEELKCYELVEHVVWIEADEGRCIKMRDIVPKSHVVICAVVSDKKEKVIFHEANNGQSSSILQLGTHRIVHPEVVYIKEYEVITDRIDSLVMGPFDFVNLDIQGADLLALKGMGELLKHVEYIYIEVNREELYKDCALVGEIDEFLIDFERVETKWTNFGWGDAFYVKREL